MTVSWHRENHATFDAAVTYVITALPGLENRIAEAAWKHRLRSPTLVAGIIAGCLTSGKYPNLRLVNQFRESILSRLGHQCRPPVG